MKDLIERVAAKVPKQRIVSDHLNVESGVWSRMKARSGPHVENIVRTFLALSELEASLSTNESPRVTLDDARAPRRSA